MTRRAAGCAWHSVRSSCAGDAADSSRRASVCWCSGKSPSSVTSCSRMGWLRNLSSTTSNGSNGCSGCCWGGAAGRCSGCWCEAEACWARTAPATTWREAPQSVALCAVLCCAVLCCAVLCCAVLCCAVLCCAVLCCAVLCCAVLCCAVLCCAEAVWEQMRAAAKRAAANSP
jgi:hypothetical protein